jgi:hypothetical protein
MVSVQGSISSKDVMHNKKELYSAFFDPDQGICLTIPYNGGTSKGKYNFIRRHIHETKETHHTN